MSFFEELRRRNVFRVGIAYVLMGWVLLQGADFVLDVIGAPEWVIRSLIVVVAIGLPIALFFAWAFEVTPEGIKREKDIDRTQSITPHTGRRLDRAIIVFLGLALALVLAERFFFAGSPGTEPDTAQPESAMQSVSVAANQESGPELTEIGLDPDSDSAASPGHPSIAVLAFENMSPDPENEYFADGISEEILNILSGIPELRVIARTSAFSFKGSEATIGEIATKLSVSHVLEGSVRKAGDRVRVTAQLIETDTESHLWSETFDRDLDDIFAVQDDIALAIADELKLQLTAEEEAALASQPTVNIEAYNRYLQGRQLWHHRGEQGLKRSIMLLEQATDLDPQFARAWAALADSYLLLPEYSNEQPRPLIARARDAVNRALELSPNLAQALTTRAYIRFLYDFEWENAERDFLRAIELEPTYATAHQWYGEYLMARDRDLETSDLRLARAAKLDPLAPIMLHVRGVHTSGLARFEEAVIFYQRALEIAPNFEASHNNLSFVYAQMGEYEQANHAWARYEELSGLTWPEHVPVLTDALQDPMQKERFLEFVDADESILRTSAVNKGAIYMLLGEHERALGVLEQGLANGDPYAAHANRMVLYDPLRDDPRFQAYLAKMNLWPPND